MKSIRIIFCMLIGLINSSNAQEAVKKWPTTGLDKHPFLYAGEWQSSSLKNQKMFIVRKGKVVWEYTMPEEGEYGDATMLSNGNILFSRKSGASEITQDKKIVWNYESTGKEEVHVCQPLGLDRVFLLSNTVPAKGMIINKVTGKVPSGVYRPRRNIP